MGKDMNWPFSQDKIQIVNRHTEIFSGSLAIRKIANRIHNEVSPMLVRMLLSRNQKTINAGKDVEEM